MRNLFSMVVLLIAGSISAASAQTTVVQFNCGLGQKLWLWGEGTDFSCQQQGTIWHCSDVAGDDVARGNCSRQCEEIRSGNLAGCYYGPTAPGFVHPNFSIICPGGQIYDITAAAEGDTCEKTANAGGETTGGQCGKKGPDGQIVDPTVIVSCSQGCISAQNPGDCKLRQ